MKISTSSAAMVLLTGAFLATSCANDVETSVNTDPEGNAISFAASVGRSTRATEIKIGNLGDFAVMARGMHPDGVLYNSYMIGSAAGGEIAKYSSLNGDGSGIWKLDRNVYWSASMSRALFIGYTTLKRDKDNNESESSENGVLGTASFSIPTGTDKPTISNFSPLKIDLSAAAATDGVWADGKDQKDLLVAFQAQDRGTSTTVNLNFRHALTQVKIQAGRKNMEDKDERIVKVKGAWLVNAAEKGKLSASIKVDKDKAGFPVTNKVAWTSEGTEIYGSYYNDGQPLTKDGSADLLRGSLMLIPQNLTAWDGKSETTTGAYIMLLCRVELVHSGTSHAGADIKDIAIEGDNHYHQLFPVNKEKYDGSEYGFVCVPLTTDWAEAVADSDDTKGMGKIYTYSLDICGSTTGAGVYPPIPQDGVEASSFVAGLIPSVAIENALVLNGDEYERQDVELKVVTKRADGKSVGDPVLDEPIKFNVTVKDWTEPENWTDGNKGNKNF